MPFETSVRRRAPASHAGAPRRGTRRFVIVPGSPVRARATALRALEDLATSAWTTSHQVIPTRPSWPAATTRAGQGRSSRRARERVPARVSGCARAPARQPANAADADLPGGQSQRAGAPVQRDPPADPLARGSSVADASVRSGEAGGIRSMGTDGGYLAAHVHATRHLHEDVPTRRRQAGRDGGSRCSVAGQARPFGGRPIWRSTCDVCQPAFR